MGIKAIKVQDYCSGKTFISQLIFFDFRQSFVAKNSIMEKKTLGHKKDSRSKKYDSRSYKTYSVENKEYLHNDKLEIVNYGKCYERKLQGTI